MFCIIAPHCTLFMTCRARKWNHAEAPRMLMCSAMLLPINMAISSSVPFTPNGPHSVCQTLTPATLAAFLSALRELSIESICELATLLYPCTVKYLNGGAFPPYV